MSLIRYSPSVLGLQQQLNRMFHEFDSCVFDHLEGLRDGVFSPVVDVREDSAAYLVQLEVPGVSRRDIDLQLQDNVLTIRGRKEQKQESGEGRYRRVERSYGTFARVLALPHKVDESAVTANLENGVLEVRLPKREAARCCQIRVGETKTGDKTFAEPQNGIAADAEPGIEAQEALPIVESPCSDY